MEWDFFLSCSQIIPTELPNTMKIQFIVPIAALFLFDQGAAAQKGPYTIKHSSEFEDVEDLPLSQTNPYPNGDVLLTFASNWT